ncbi:hypothetical protein [Aeromicrobium sp. 9AM]|uniref:hypothetical protein n=1 Tax=Aeromicrobium sp. 9AM TaxID=2653126 RepID=UPI0012F1741F|nr:hypothetical protein [Aeromicrobium sp. 9AM]VXC49696.1 hypothetical protein AERO9AM_70466 [Aeromicrobium sp. 9AM]
MRLILGGIALVLLGTLTACGGGDDGGGAKTTKSAPRTPDRFIACDLLTQKQRDVVVGAKVDVQGRPENDFPSWACTFGDTPEPSAPNQVTYRGMRARVWAQKVPELVAREPASPQAKKFLADVLKRAGLTESDLALIDDDAACDLWNVLQDATGATVDGDTTSATQTVDEIDAQVARASTCSQGIYADVLAIGSDADSAAGRKRAETALSTIYANAAERLPR